MSKYDCLKDPPDNDIYGKRYSEVCSSFVHKEDGTIIIHGFPACPECKHTLARQFYAGKWSCSECETVWNDNDLVQAIEEENKLIKGLNKIKE